MTQIIGQREFKVKMCEALGLDPLKIRRVVLDLDLDSPVIAYVEMYGDERLLDIEVKLAPQDMKIVLAKKE